MLSNIKSWRSQSYLDWVKTLPSCISGQPAGDPHHVKGHGMGGTVKAPDWAVIPLTGGEHTLFHAIGWRTWEQQYGSQLEYVGKTLGLAIEQGILTIAYPFKIKGADIGRASK